MNTHLEILVKELIKNGVSAKCCEIITDNEGNVSASEPFLDFSEHDKKVAEEKDKRIAELEKIIDEKSGGWGKCGLTLSEIIELQDRHQSDCIEINRLHTALEVMTEKYVKLREIHGL